MCIKHMKKSLTGMIKIAAKNGVADLEFGISGQPWKIRSGHKI